MQFPARERVIYDNNPLVEVVCQVRFPRILAVDDGIPAQFQMDLGSEYPFVETTEVVQFAFSAGSDPAPSKRTHYNFKTEDQNYTITLCSEFIAVSASNYKQWELFSSHADKAVNALCKNYSTPIFTRIGLRYVNKICRERLKLSEKWTDLVRPSALGLLSEDDVPIDDLMEMSTATVLRLTNGGKVVIRTVFERDGSDSSQTNLTIDSDFFEDSPTRGPENALSKLSEFNQHSGRAFRWVISDRLHDALGPNTAANA